MRDRNEIDRDAVKARLIARREELRSLVAASGDGRQPVELDQQRVGRLSRMDAIQMQAMAQETERRRALEARQIAAALQRLEEGEYGYCIACGEPIARQRLELDATASRCIDCARERG